MKQSGLKKWIVAGVCGCISGNLAVWAQDVVLRVDPSQVEQQVTPWLYGACIEDVNHEIYGGLYDQKIFGESFEEPAPGEQIKGFSAYEGRWSVADNTIRVAEHWGAKLVYDGKEAERGSVETELRFNGRGENAGLLLSVSEPGKGADRFNGYEVSLTADGKKVVIAGHLQDFRPMTEVAVDCNPKEWNTLRAELRKNEIEIFLNNKSVYCFARKEPQLKRGKVALRTWGSDVSFRNLHIADGKQVHTPELRSLPVVAVSSAWDAVADNPEQSVYRIDTEQAYNGRQSQVMEMTAADGQIGVANSGLNRWGIAVRKGQTFRGRLYLKGNAGKVAVALQSRDGKREYARRELTAVSETWKRHDFELTSVAADKQARLAVLMNGRGKLWIDQVTLMTTGEDRFKGLPYRNDIGQAMVNQGLTFLRYGGTMVNAPEYRFKKMIGDPDKRPPYRGHWYTYSTNGFGIEDFLKFCEAAGFKASFAINIEETPEDVADMIEYLNGGTDTEWGRKRAENGHPQPYGIEYIGIGNEEVLFHGDRADEYAHYVERFLLLHEAIRRKDPSVKLVSTAWWRPDSPNMEWVFKALDGKADYWDYHPWADDMASGKNVEAELRRMKHLFTTWNPDTKMKCAIFEENGNLHNMQRVLGHVTLQNAVRRMGDFVLTSCAANALQPYLQNDNGWDQGQVFFTPSQVWGMPPYYAQQMASRHHLPLLVKSSVESENIWVDMTATRSEDGRKLVLHLANTNAKEINARLEVSGFENVGKVTTVVLSGKPEDVNTPEDPRRIVPETRKIKMDESLSLGLKPYSYTIVVMEK